MNMIVKWIAKVTRKSKRSASCLDIPIACTLNTLFAILIGMSGVVSLIFLGIYAVCDERINALKIALFITGALFIVWILSLRAVEIYIDSEEEDE